MKELDAMKSEKSKKESSGFDLIPVVFGAQTKHVLKVSNFLLKEERDHLLETVCTHQSAFKPLGIPDPDGGGTLHLSLGPENNGSSEIEPIRKVCEPLANKIEALLPKIFEMLGVNPFPISKIPLSIGNGLNGHTGSVHNDESGGRFKISILYYFHKIPKVFQGGALELFATDEDAQDGYEKSPFAKIEHEDNLLIAFPSETYHGVTDVTLDSTKFEEGRFVIVGFLGSQ